MFLSGSGGLIIWNLLFSWFILSFIGCLMLVLLDLEWYWLNLLLDFFIWWKGEEFFLCEFDRLREKLLELFSDVRLVRLFGRRVGEELKLSDRLDIWDFLDFFMLRINRDFRFLIFLFFFINCWCKDLICKRENIYS